MHPSELDILGWAKSFVNIIDIHKLIILILLFFDNFLKNIRLQLLKLNKTSKMNILGTT